MKKKHKPHKEKTEVVPEQAKGAEVQGEQQDNSNAGEEQQQQQQNPQRAHGDTKSLKYELQNQGK